MSSKSASKTGSGKKPQVKNIHLILNEFGKLSPMSTFENTNPCKKMDLNFPIIKPTSSPKRLHSPTIRHRSPLIARVPTSSPKGTKERYCATPPRPEPLSPNVRIVKHYKKLIEEATRTPPPMRKSSTPIDTATPQISVAAAVCLSENDKSINAGTLLNTSAISKTVDSSSVETPDEEIAKSSRLMKTVSPSKMSFKSPLNSNKRNSNASLTKSPTVGQRKSTNPSGTPVGRKSTTPLKSPQSAQKNGTRSPSMTRKSNRSSQLGSPLGPLMSTHRKRIVKTGTYSAPASKYKRVSFGPQLSPQHFDKNMPPATPLKRGALPRKSACLSEKVKATVREIKKTSTPFDFSKSYNHKSGAARMSLNQTANPFSPSKTLKGMNSTPIHSSSRISGFISLPPTPDSNLLDSNASRNTYSLSPTSARNSPANKKASSSSAPTTPVTKMSPARSNQLTKSAVLPNKRQSMKSPPAPMVSPANKSIRASPSTSALSNKSVNNSPRPPRHSSPPLRFIVDVGESVLSHPVTEAPTSSKPQNKIVVTTYRSPLPDTEPLQKTSVKRRASSLPKESSPKKAKIDNAATPVQPEDSEEIKKKSWASIVKQKNVPMQKRRPKTPMKPKMKTPISRKTPLRTKTPLQPKSVKRTWASVVKAKRVPIQNARSILSKKVVMNARRKKFTSAHQSEFCKLMIPGQFAPPKYPNRIPNYDTSPETIFITNKKTTNYSNTDTYSSSIVLSSTYDDVLESTVKQISQTPKQRSSSSLVDVPESVKTPASVRKASLQGVRKSFKTSSNIESPQKLVKTPVAKASPKNTRVNVMVNSESQSPKISGIKAMKSPRMTGVKALLKTPKPDKSPRMAGLKDLVKTPKPAKSPRISGIKDLVKTPKPAKSPQFAGLKLLMKTPKLAQSPKMSGVKKLLKTPKPAMSPRISGVKDLMRAQKSPKSPRMAGVKELFQSTKSFESPRLAGLRNLVKSPKSLKSPNLVGIKDMFKPDSVLLSPDLQGVRELMRSPKAQLSPSVDGINFLFSTPKDSQNASSNKSKSITGRKSKTLQDSHWNGNDSNVQLSSNIATEKNISLSLITSPPKPKRGGRTKNVATQLTHKVESASLQVSPQKPRRGGRPKRVASKMESQKDMEIVSTHQDESVTLQKSPPKPRRGGPKRVTPEVESKKDMDIVSATQEESASILKSPPKSRRGGRRVVSKLETVKESETRLIPMLILKDAASWSIKKSPPKPRNGGRKRVAAGVENAKDLDNSTVLSIADEGSLSIKTSPPKPRRGGRQKNATIGGSSRISSSPKQVKTRGRKATAQTKKSSPIKTVSKTEETQSEEPTSKSIKQSAHNVRKPTVRKPAALKKEEASLNDNAAISPAKKRTTRQKVNPKYNDFLIESPVKVLFPSVSSKSSVKQNVSSKVVESSVDTAAKKKSVRSKLNDNKMVTSEPPSPKRLRSRR